VNASNAGEAHETRAEAGTRSEARRGVLLPYAAGATSEDARRRPGIVRRSGGYFFNSAFTFSITANASAT
jgi:hypothetical protein